MEHQKIQIMDSFGENPGPKCSSINVEEYDENLPLIEMLPNVIQTLKGAGKVNEFID